MSVEPIGWLLNRGIFVFVCYSRLRLNYLTSVFNVKVYVYILMTKWKTFLSATETHAVSNQNMLQVS